jgi:hypothetical protein
MNRPSLRSLAGNSIAAPLLQSKLFLDRRNQPFAKLFAVHGQNRSAVFERDVKVRTFAGCENRPLLL